LPDERRNDSFRITVHGQPTDAEAFTQEALKIDESRARDPNQSADVGEASLLLAQAKFARGDFNGALAIARRATEILTHSLGADHSLTVAAAALVPRQISFSECRALVQFECVEIFAAFGKAYLPKY